MKRTHFHTPSTPLLFCADPELVSISFFFRGVPMERVFKKLRHGAGVDIQQAS